ncbi:MAG TPA: hypothetical protein VFW31_09860 [Candidatus Angelobacter sp.]|nr:hypothetical protein [Candidatus Angelobacter sp.]
MLERLKGSSQTDAELEDSQMQKFKLSVLGAICLSVVIVGSFFATQRTASASSDDVSHRPSWERINRAATNAKGGDPAAISTLADEVFRSHGIDQMTTTVAPFVKGRLLRAEADFQNGKASGITEDQVAATVNQLADRVNAPDYAHTNASEVKKLRLRMITLFPALIGRGPAASRDDSRPHFDAKMSPIEAFEVTAMMIEQKMFNPEFQLSDKERQETPGGQTLASNRHGERTQEMLNVAQRGINLMGFDQMQQQCKHSLDLLGIEGGTQ